MGYSTKVQLISRKDNRWNQWYINFPNALAQALNLKKGEIVEWELISIDAIKLNRVSLQNKNKKNK